jgi:DNA-binding transcriptional regulator YdaS (Cro superfamily)
MANQALHRAVAAAGGQKALASRIGTTQSMIWYWLERSRRGAAAEFVIAIEGATGIPRQELRPDLYPSNQAGPSEQEGRAV